MSDAATYERDLTPKELEQRAARRDQLDDERDDLIASVAERRREIRSLNASRKKLELELLDVRREIRSGKVIESRQMAFPIVAVTDDPFEKAFPQALSAERLHRDLSLVLQGVLVPSLATLEGWPPSIFLPIAHWARTELAYMNRNASPEAAQLELPPRGRMPDKLAEARQLLGDAADKRSSRKRRRQPQPTGELAAAELAEPPAGKKRTPRKAKVSGTPTKGHGRRAKRGARA